MWMVVTYRRAHMASRLAWFDGWHGHLAIILHSSNEPGELSQWPCHDDSAINIVTGVSCGTVIME